MAILLMVIHGYSINGYSWLLLMAIRDYPIYGYSWLFY
jgi:hypothetical protein